MAYTSGNIYSGERTGIGTTAVPVATNTVNIREALIQSDPSNTTNVLVGSALAQEMVLTPGQSITIPVISLSIIYVKMASGTGIVNWLTRD